MLYGQTTLKKIFIHNKFKITEFKNLDNPVNIRPKNTFESMGTTVTEEIQN